LVRIGTIATPELIGFLRQNDIDDIARKEAAEALGKIGGPFAVPTLISLLGDSAHWMRTLAAEALGKIGDTSAVQALKAADSKFHVRGVCQYCRALQLLKDK
jgi:HEAT repeat protein